MDASTAAERSPEVKTLTTALDEPILLRVARKNSPGSLRRPAML
jgi:hypothetical protein